jgi:hypothetical protein
MHRHDTSHFLPSACQRDGPIKRDATCSPSYTHQPTACTVPTTSLPRPNYPTPARKSLRTHAPSPIEWADGRSRPAHIRCRPRGLACPSAPLTASASPWPTPRDLYTKPYVWSPILKDQGTATVSGGVGGRLSAVRVWSGCGPHGAMGPWEEALDAHGVARGVPAAAPDVGWDSDGRGWMRTTRTATMSLVFDEYGRPFIIIRDQVRAPPRPGPTPRPAADGAAERSHRRRRRG